MHCEGPILRGKIFGRTYGRFDEFSGHKLKRLLLTESLLMFANIDESRKSISPLCRLTEVQEQVILSKLNKVSNEN